MEFVQLSFHGDAQTANPFPDQVGACCREIQTKVAASFLRMSVGCVERVAGNEGDVLADRSLEELLGVHAFGQRHPQEKTALGTGPGYFRREGLSEDLQHNVAALAIDASYELNVLIEKVISRHFVGHDLGGSGGVQVRALFQLHKLGDDLWWSDNPAKAQSGGQRLREGTQVNDVADRVTV